MPILSFVHGQRLEHLLSNDILDPCTMSGLVPTASTISRSMVLVLTNKSSFWAGTIVDHTLVRVGREVGTVMVCFNSTILIVCIYMETAEVLMDLIDRCETILSERKQLKGEQRTDDI